MKFSWNLLHPTSSTLHVTIERLNYRKLLWEIVKIMVSVQVIRHTDFLFLLLYRAFW
jgi:hypothetical protein